MTALEQARLRKLALEELHYLAHEQPTAAHPLVAALLRLEAEARSVFLLDEHDAAEVRSVLARLVQGWRALLASEQLSRSRPPAGPMARESMMTVWDVALGGLWTAAALEDRESMASACARLGSHDTQLPELGKAGLVQVHQICLLHQGNRTEAARQQRERWQDWVELEFVHPEDDTWSALRGIADSDERAVQRALEALAYKRQLALNHAIAGGVMLRAIPARLVLETEAAALVRLARIGGMAISAAPSAILTRRARELWRFG